MASAVSYNKKIMGRTEDDDIELLLKVSIYYFDENMTQQEIAEKMGITRQSVSKYLGLARDRGIVEIRVKNPISVATSLEDELLHSFSETRLKYVAVTPGNFYEYPVIRQVIAQRACEYISELLVKGKYGKIGLSWGRTVRDIISQLPDVYLKSRPEVIPMLGSTDNSIPYFMVNEMIVDFASKINGLTRQIFLPLDTECTNDYLCYTSTKQYEKLLAYWSSLDMAIVGIGSNPLQSEVRRSLYPREPEIVESIAAMKPVGDVCTSYFDINGETCRAKSDVLIAIKPNIICTIPRVIAAAGGLDKVESITGAIRSGMITDLITDERTAKALLSCNMNK